MDQGLIEILENTGFTEKEAKVYLALLELGVGDVTEIAKRAELKRSIIYIVLESLIKRGYISKVVGKKINTYQTGDPTLILNQLKSVTKNFSEMIPIFLTLRNKGEKRPKISYYETLEGIWNVYEEMNQVENSFFITSYSKIEKYFPGGIDKWLNNYKNGLYKLKGRHLISNSPRDIEIGRELAKIDQKVRVFTGQSDISMDFTIFGKKIALTAFDDEPFIIIIKSEELVKSMKPIFEIAWNKGTDIPMKK